MYYLLSLSSCDPFISSQGGWASHTHPRIWLYC
nr:MAG TPA: CHC2 zinc finger protein [Caudoviricetes sp.]